VEKHVPLTHDLRQTYTHTNKRIFVFFVSPSLQSRELLQKHIGFESVDESTTWTIKPVYETLSVSYFLVDVRFWNTMIHWEDHSFIYWLQYHIDIEKKYFFSSRTDLRQYIQFYYDKHSMPNHFSSALECSDIFSKISTFKYQTYDKTSKWTPSRLSASLRSATHDQPFQ
jgi:hypothetical protein